MHRATIIALICCLVAGGGARAQPFDYPAARLATTWANTDAALPHHVVYTDGSVARAALLRLNPAGLGPSYAFGFFCTASRPRGDGPAAPCTEFLLGVAVVYCNSGAACGAYGVCTDDTQCSCPDAANFRPVDFRRPNRGCVPTAPPPTSCRPPRGPQTQHRLVSLPRTAYFNDHTTSMRAVDRVSEEACKKACLDDCACAAAQFYYGPDSGDGSCYLQSEVFSMQTVQPDVVHYNSTMHIKVQAKPARN
uniref:Uncharacterized protein n=1 Tax=Aegilops tauschii TaxID=37682 RepID=N1QUU5_AEGTA